jgi:hypothetical protein
VVGGSFNIGNRIPPVETATDGAAPAEWVEKVVVQFEDSYQGMPFRHATPREIEEQLSRRGSGTGPASAAKAFRLAEQLRHR